jgi:hypothetical protein
MLSPGTTPISGNNNCIRGSLNVPIWRTSYFPSFRPPVFGRDFLLLPLYCPCVHRYHRRCLHGRLLTPSRVVLSDVLGGKDVVEGLDGRTDKHVR